MFDFSLSRLLSDLIFRLPAVVIALTVHEFSHAMCAYKLGDGTAKHLGRLTLNPLKHLDPIGLVCLYLFYFGWAKPVPVNPYNFRAVDGKTGMMLTALAGPMSNILMCFICVGLVHLIPFGRSIVFTWLYVFLNYLIAVNTGLAFFNLIPIPPLDGSKILFGLLPDRLYYITQYLERYSSIFLIVLLVSRIPEMILGPLTRGLITSFHSFYGLFLR